jgi:RNA polymerase sigma-70 factor (ECF subfamily)
MSRESLSKVSFEELLERARAGEAGALDELFRRSRPTIDKWISRRRMPTSAGDARPSDISQDILERVLGGFARFKGNTAGEWFSWIKTILGNRIAETSRSAQARKRAAAGVVPLDSQEATRVASRDMSPSQATSRREEWHGLYACIYELPEAQREAIWLHHLKDLSVPEVARRMKRTESAVTGLLYRGWEQVKARMRAEPAPDPERSPEAAPQDEAAVAFMAYLRLCDAKAHVDKEAFIAEHPGCADKLRDMIHWIERLKAHRPSVTKK